jgi:hypothetical protein
MRGWIIGACALLSAGAAHGKAAGEPYAKVGAWEITAQADKKWCTMDRWYASSDGAEVEGLLVLYDAQKEGVSFTWTSRTTTSLPPEGSLELGLSFQKARSSSRSWRSRAFHYQKLDDTYYFVHVFKKPNDVRQLLTDLAGHANIAMFSGANLMMALSLDASGAVEKLRECSLKLAGRDPREPFLK